MLSKRNDLGLCLFLNQNLKPRPFCNLLHLSCNFDKRIDTKLYLDRPPVMYNNEYDPDPVTNYFFISQGRKDFMKKVTNAKFVFDFTDIYQCYLHGKCDSKYLLRYCLNQVARRFLSHLKGMQYGLGSK